MKSFLTYICLIIISALSYNAEVYSYGVACKEMTTPCFQVPDHILFDALLKKYVSKEGKVYYKSLKKNEKKLDKYLSLLSANPPSANWSKQDSMAFWINAYNACTLKLILDHYPIKSILDLHAGKPWSVQWIKIGNKTLSLDNIEHDILRPQFKDPRVHFAVNCASNSCPPLFDGAYTGKTLERQLEGVSKKFINNHKFQTISKTKVTLSKLFEWYSADFGNVLTFMNKYATTKINSNALVSYAPYDWLLNEAK